MIKKKGVIEGRNELNVFAFVTKDEKTGGLDFDITIDNDWMSGNEVAKLDENGNEVLGPDGKPVKEHKTGLQIMASDLSAIPDLVYTKEFGIGGNLEGAGKNIGKEAVRDGKKVIDTTEDVVKTVKDVVNREEISVDQTLEVFETRQDNREEIEANKIKNEALNKGIKNVMKEGKGIDVLKEKLVDYIVDGKNVKDVKLVREGKIIDGVESKAYIDPDSKVMYINIGKNGINLNDTKKVIEVMIHEKNHGKQGNPQTDKAKAESEAFAQIGADAAKSELKWQRNLKKNPEEKTNQQEWLNNQPEDQKNILTQDEQSGANVKNPQNLTVIVETNSEDPYGSKAYRFFERPVIEKNKNGEKEFSIKNALLNLTLVPEVFSDVVTRGVSEKYKEQVAIVSGIYEGEAVMYHKKLAFRLNEGEKIDTLAPNKVQGGKNEADRIYVHSMNRNQSFDKTGSRGCLGLCGGELGNYKDYMANYKKGDTEKFLLIRIK